MENEDIGFLGSLGALNKAGEATYIDGRKQECETSRSD